MSPNFNLLHLVSVHLYYGQTPFLVIYLINFYLKTSESFVSSTSE